MKIGIIGGKGIMGQFFARHFRNLGIKVAISDLDTKLTNQKLIENSDVVAFAVPLQHTEKIIRASISHVRADQLLIDFSSLKVGPVRAMMKSKAAVIGLHPMFRPGPQGLKEQTIAMCIGRASLEQKRMVREWFTNSDARIIEMTPKKHDELMSIIQVLLHFHTIVLGNTFRKLKIPVAETLQIASPVYRLEMDLIGRIFSQDPNLYAAIEILNPKTSRVTRALMKETLQLAKIVQSKDFLKFRRNFSKTSKFLGSFKLDAMREIDSLLAYLQKS